MSEIYLVRHGQASLGADNYDQLSPLGVQQSVWLGEYFADRNMHFDHVVVGGQIRHQQTLDGISRSLELPPSELPDSGLNEFEFQHLIASYLQRNPQHPQPGRTDVRAIFSTFKLAMHAWAGQELGDDMPETLDEFLARVTGSYEAIVKNQSARKILLVTSGGPISIILKHLMGFGIDTLVGLQVQSRNTALSHIYFNNETTYVTSFNHVPHLDLPDRLEAITHA